MKATLLIVLAMAMPLTLWAQENGSEKSKPTFGYEIDALPFILGGYYGSMWVGKDRTRFRAVLTEFRTPDFFLESGFTNNKIRSYAAIGDYFFEPGFEQWWIGAGMEYWKGRIQTDAGLSTEKYDQLILTFGGGYAWKFHRRFYLNPWAAIHARIAGDANVTVDEEEFNPAIITPEVSIKIGWHF